MRYITLYMGQRDFQLAEKYNGRYTSLAMSSGCSTNGDHLTALNAEIAVIVQRQQELRDQIDAIVADLEGNS